MPTDTPHTHAESLPRFRQPYAGHFFANPRTYLEEPGISNTRFNETPKQHFVSSMFDSFCEHLVLRSLGRVVSPIDYLIKATPYLDLELISLRRPLVDFH